MYLKRLELHGFKSFADKTVLDFMPGITTVIGPNGSGKSNISDSIRWVLGEQSMKSLRGTKSEDIIFAGTQNRKSLGFAEASIVFDNSDGKLPIEFEEVTVTRRIYRSGDSGYFINKTPCRLKDVLELFMDTGIGKDGYSIIGQGKIDEILSNKSEDRRGIFEEAAGIVKYRARKNESEKKLEQTKLNLLRINDILSEIEGSIEPLKLQSEKAKTFLNLRDELKSIEIGLFLYNIDTYKEKISEITKDMDIITTQKEAENVKLEEMQSLKEKLRINLDEITNKIEEVQNLSFESTNKIEKINSEINVAKTKKLSNTENYERYIKEIEELKGKIKSLEEEKVTRIEKKNNLEINKERFVRELEEKQIELNKITTKLSSEEIEVEEKKRKVEEHIDLKYEKKEEINTINVNRENLEKREKTLKTEIAETISMLDNKRLKRVEISKTFSDIENKRNEYQKRVNVINEKRDESGARIKDYENKINKIASEIRIKQSKHKFLSDMEKEKEGYARSVKSILLECETNSNLNKGMHGVLANIITVPKQYETAIEMTLNGALQNIVTETEEDAKRLIEYLRTKNLGRASFLPITSVKGKKMPEVRGEGVIGIASDLVKVDKKYEEIILNLLGKTIVVKDMDTAINIARKNKYSFRIVTLEGDIINASGSMSGGANAKKTGSIIGRAGEIKALEKEIIDLKKSQEEIENEKNKYEESIESILEESISLEKESQEIEITYATEKQRIISIEETIKSIEQHLESLKTELLNIENTKKYSEASKETLEEEVIDIERTIENLQKGIKEFADKNKDTQKYIDDLNFDITNLKISVNSFDESNNSIEEILSRINLDIENSTKSVEYKQNKMLQINEENKNLEESVINYKKQIDEINLKLSTSSNEINKLKEERIVKNDELKQKEQDIQNQFVLIEELKNQISKQEVKQSKFQMELEQVINKMWEEYELTPNNVEQYKKPENIAKTTKQVKELRDKIKNLGNINVDSIEEYKQTKERYDFMCEQRLDLETSSNKLKKVIQDMIKIMKEQFEQQFNIINKNFGEVFTELFGGGKAELKLTDKENILECGIEIEVQPPGKKLQNMNLLSGGEKAFTAIALLFAILKINPAPFCVLDEIEAALDDVNVYRFAEYLKKFTKDTQFLVITHRKGTMEVADTIYGITMEESGISKLLSMKLS